MPFAHTVGAKCLHGDGWGLMRNEKLQMSGFRNGLYLCYQEVVVII